MSITSESSWVTYHNHSKSHWNSPKLSTDSLGRVASSFGTYLWRYELWTRGMDALGLARGEGEKLTLITHKLS